MRRLITIPVALFVLLSWCATADQQIPKLNIVIVEGQGAINNIKRRTARETIVQVEDENHKPIAGAAVAFLLPGSGPGGTFADGAKSTVLVTDNSGKAMMPQLHLNSNAGSFAIQVTASHQGLAATAAIAQSSIVGAAAISTVAVVAIIATVAATGGAVLAVTMAKGNMGSNPSQPPQTPAGTVGAGGATVFGPPH